jgi:hypothetical protein
MLDLFSTGCRSMMVQTEQLLPSGSFCATPPWEGKVPLNVSAARISPPPSDTGEGPSHLPGSWNRDFNIH